MDWRMGDDGSRYRCFLDCSHIKQEQGDLGYFEAEEFARIAPRCIRWKTTFQAFLFEVSWRASGATILWPIRAFRSMYFRSREAFPS